MPPGTNLHNEALDDEVSIRFQTTFLPVEDRDRRATMEFCTQAFNYNTRNDSEPRNAVLLCTSQGVAVQQDGAGKQSLLHHAVDASGTVTQHWLEAERSDFAVGGPQEESEEVAVEAACRGKATASVIGIEGMGARFNALMTVQVPLQQAPEVMRSAAMFGRGGGSGRGRGAGRGAGRGGGRGAGRGAQAQCSLKRFRNIQGSRVPDREAERGESFAARVSRGSAAGEFSRLTVAAPKRAQQHVTCTVVFYNVVAGGLPTAADVLAAIADMEAMYAMCEWDGRLANEGAAFMKTALTRHDTACISAKLQQHAPHTGLLKFPT